MIDQLEISLKGDTSLTYVESILAEINSLTVFKYKQKTLKELTGRRDYYLEQREKDADRNKSRVEWLQQLLDSLK